MALVPTLLAYGGFGSPHYGLPATLVAAPALARWRRGSIAAFVLAIFAAGQIVLALS